jgi:hypothetical protein
MRGAFLLSVAWLAAGGAVACTFPEVTYAPQDGSMGPSDGAAGGDGRAHEDGGGGGEGDGDDATVDVIEDRVADVVSDYVFEAAPDADPCDKDRDGHRDKSNLAACGADADDCCDTDPRVYPGEPSYYAAAYDCRETSSVSFDYNCDGKDEGEYSVNLQQTCGGLSLTGCQGTGFIGDPGCGGTGPFGNCAPSGLSCSAQTTSATEQQYCR